MRNIQIQSRTVGDGCRVFIAAEIGINHNGDPSLAKRMIAVAAQAGADAVKFQNYCTEDFVSDRSLMYEYVSEGTVVAESHKPPHAIEQPDDGKPLTAGLDPKEVHELPNGDAARAFGDVV